MDSKNKSMISINIAIWAIVIVFVVILGMYFYTFRNGISNDSNDWSAFGTLVGSMGMLLFSVINIKIWLYQTEKSNKAMNYQIKLAEMLTVINPIQTNLLLISKLHYNYSDFEKYKEETLRILQRLDFDLFGHLFNVNHDLIKIAYKSVDELDEIWNMFRIEDLSTQKKGETDIFNQEFKKRIINFDNSPFLRIIKDLRSQIS
jgi:flagellar basal body-associated protein FliL